MRFNKLDLNLLVALDAMLAEKNISRAAERMHMSQSAMSNALSRLRQYFEDDLLVQVGRRMDLTPRAEMLQESVRDVLLRVDIAVATSPVFDYASSDREFTLFVSDFTLQTLLPHMLALTHKRAPNVRFRLQPQAREPERAMERGEVDLLVIPERYCSPAHPAEALFDEQLSCVVWSGSPLAQGPLTLEQYTGAGHVAVSPGLNQHAFDHLALQQEGVERRIEVTTFSFTSAAGLVVATDRIATVHERLARQAARQLPLVIHPLPVPTAPMRQFMQWHKYRAFDPGIVWLREVMHEAVVAMHAAD